MRLKLLAAGANIKASMNDVDESDDSKLRLDPEYNYRIGGRTPLMYATAFAGYPLIRYLLDHGAERAAVDSSGAKAEKYLTDNKLISKAERVELLNMLHR